MGHSLKSGLLGVNSLHSRLGDCSSPTHSPQHSPTSSPLPHRKKGQKEATILTKKSLLQGRIFSEGHSGGFLKLFPTQVAMLVGVLKLGLGTGMAVLGGLGLAVEAALSPLGGGLWAGAVVGLSGFLAVCTARRPRSLVYMVSLAGVSLLSMTSSALLLALSAAAWATDTGAAPPAFLQQLGLLPPATFPPPRAGLSAPVLVSGALVLLAAADCLLSAACAAIAARQLCRWLSGGAVGRGLSEGHNRKERLYRWLGQQKTIFPIGTATAGASGGQDTGVASVPSVCQFVPLAESSSSASLDQLSSPYYRTARPHGRSSNAGYVRTEPADTPRSHGHLANGADYASHSERLTYFSRDDVQWDVGQNGRLKSSESRDQKTGQRDQRANTFAKYAKPSPMHGRYETGHYDINGQKSNQAQNPYSRRSSSGKTNQSLLYSGNSTLHSTLASYSTQPCKSGNSVTTKLSTGGSSQITTSAYLSSSSDSRQPKSMPSYPTQVKSKSSQLSSNFPQYPSLPNIAPQSSSSAVVMAAPSQSSHAQYAPVYQKNRAASERYYSEPQAYSLQQQHHHSGHYALPQRPQQQLYNSYYAAQNQQQLYNSYYSLQQQNPAHLYYYTPQKQEQSYSGHRTMQHYGHKDAHSSYLTLQPLAGNRLAFYPSLPPPRMQYSHPAHPQLQHPTHPSLYYPHIGSAAAQAYYNYAQIFDVRKQKKRLQRPHSAVQSSKLSKSKKIKSKNSKKSKQKKGRGWRRGSGELTDEQIEQSYTGLDRAIAEGFINTMMEPAMSNVKPG